MKGYIELNDEGTIMLLALHNVAAVMKRGEYTAITLHTVTTGFDPISHTKLVTLHYDDVVTLIERAQA